VKILFANNYYYLRGGSERVLFDEIDSLEQSGHEIVPFSRIHVQNSKTVYDNFFLPVVNFESMGGIGKARAAVEVVYSRRMKRTFGALLDHEKPDLVHGHNIYSGLTYSIVDAAKSRAIPFVLTLHDLKLACPTYLMLNRGKICERCGTGSFWNCAVQRCHKESLAASVVNTAEAYFNKIFRKYDWISRFLCPSRFLLEKIATAGIPREKLVHLPNALDPAAYEPNCAKGGYVLFVGRLSKEKGVLTLLKSFKDLNVPLRIVGTGAMEAECREFADLHGMSHVTFEGYCQGEKLKDLFHQAAFLVVPSECYENAPMSILEAFAYGKPVVGSNLGGTPELVLPDETGLLFEAGNAEILAGVISALWGDPAKIESMGRAARRRIETDFCTARNVKRLLEIYGKIV